MAHVKGNSKRRNNFVMLGGLLLISYIVSALSLFINRSTSVDFITKAYLLYQSEDSVIYWASKRTCLGGPLTWREIWHRKLILLLSKGDIRRINISDMQSHTNHFLNRTRAAILESGGNEKDFQKYLAKLRSKASESY